MQSVAGVDRGCDGLYMQRVLIGFGVVLLGAVAVSEFEYVAEKAGHKLYASGRPGGCQCVFVRPLHTERLLATRNIALVSDVAVT